MHRTALILEYDGGFYAGYQRQEGANTVQAEIENTLSTILRERIGTVCCGRTDSGVHATGQVIAFSSAKEPPAKKRFVFMLNSLLPKTIVVRASFPVPSSFHPRFSCLAREYEYLIWNSTIRSPLWLGRALWFHPEIDLEFVNQQLECVIGSNDFAAFTRYIHRDKETTRYIDSAAFFRVQDTLTGRNIVIFRIRGNAFLHNMIRILTGTVLDIFRGKLTMSLAEIMETKDRTKAGQTAPPHGLYFRNAYYPPEMSFDGHLLTLNNYPVFRRPPGEEKSP